MRRLSAALIWLAAGALALAVFLAAAANAQEPPRPGCVADPLEPTATMPPKNAFGEVTNLSEKKVDIVIVTKPTLWKVGTPGPTPTTDGYRYWAEYILGKSNLTNQQIVEVNNLQEAIAAIDNAYTQNNPPRKLNVFIVGHGLPGWIEVGTDAISNLDAPDPLPIDTWRDNQATFIAAMTNPDKIQHLKFVSCLTAADQGFMNKMAAGLHAARVSGFTNELWVFAPQVINSTPNPWYATPENAQYKQYDNTFRILLPGQKKEVGGIIVDQDTGVLSLQSESSRGSDAKLLAEVIGGLGVIAAALGGATWFVRRRRAE